jgi:hypothetical protein
MWEDVEDALSMNRDWVMNWVDLGEDTPEVRTVIDSLCKMNGGESCFDFESARLPEMIATIVSKYTGSS